MLDIFISGNEDQALAFLKQNGIHTVKDFFISKRKDKYFFATFFKEKVAYQALLVLNPHCICNISFQTSKNAKKVKDECQSVIRSELRILRKEQANICTLRQEMKANIDRAEKELVSLQRYNDSLLCSINMLKQKKEKIQREKERAEEDLLRFQCFWSSEEKSLDESDDMIDFKVSGQPFDLQKDFCLKFPGTWFHCIAFHKKDDEPVILNRDLHSFQSILQCLMAIYHKYDFDKTFYKKIPDLNFYSVRQIFEAKWG